MDMGIGTQDQFVRAHGEQLLEPAQCVELIQCFDVLNELDAIPSEHVHTTEGRRGRIRPHRLYAQQSYCVHSRSSFFWNHSAKALQVNAVFCFSGFLAMAITNTACHSSPSRAT